MIWERDAMDMGEGCYGGGVSDSEVGDHEAVVRNLGEGGQQHPHIYRLG
jgi:hypothetical protein